MGEATIFHPHFRVCPAIKATLSDRCVVFKSRFTTAGIVRDQLPVKAKVDCLCLSFPTVYVLIKMHIRYTSHVTITYECELWAKVHSGSKV